MDTIRKKVGVARRKAADFPTNSQTDQDKKEAGPSKSQPTIDYRVSIIDATVHRDSEQLDFEDICRFFAAGGGDNSDDEAVWASLASHVSQEALPRLGNIIKHLPSNLAEVPHLGQNSTKVKKSQLQKRSKD
jgi:hypothetical protein